MFCRVRKCRSRRRWQLDQWSPGPLRTWSSVDLGFGRQAKPCSVRRLTTSVRSLNSRPNSRAIEVSCLDPPAGDAILEGHPSFARVFGILQRVPMPAPSGRQIGVPQVFAQDLGSAFLIAVQERLAQ